MFILEGILADKEVAHVFAVSCVFSSISTLNPQTQRAVRRSKRSSRTHHLATLLAGVVRGRQLRYSSRCSASNAPGNSSRTCGRNPVRSSSHSQESSQQKSKNT